MLGKRKSKFMLYNTKMKGVELKFDANRDGAYVILELNHSNEEERLAKYEQFERYKVVMEEDFPQGLIWNFAYVRKQATKFAEFTVKKTELLISTEEAIGWLFIVLCRKKC